MKRHSMHSSAALGRWRKARPTSLSYVCSPDQQACSESGRLLRKATFFPVQDVHMEHLKRIWKRNVIRGRARTARTTRCTCMQLYERERVRNTPVRNECRASRPALLQARRLQKLYSCTVQPRRAGCAHRSRACPALPRSLGARDSGEARAALISLRVRAGGVDSALIPANPPRNTHKESVSISSWGMRARGAMGRLEIVMLSEILLFRDC
jgi:hypothetical protein